MQDPRHPGDHDHGGNDINDCASHDHHGPTYLINGRIYDDNDRRRFDHDHGGNDININDRINDLFPHDVVVNVAQRNLNDRPRHLDVRPADLDDDFHVHDDHAATPNDDDEHGAYEHYNDDGTIDHRADNFHAAVLNYIDDYHAGAFNVDPIDGFNNHVRAVYDAAGRILNDDHVLVRRDNLNFLADLLDNARPHHVATHVVLSAARTLVDNATDPAG